MKEYLINTQYTIYLNCPKKDSQGEFCNKPRGTVQTDRWFSGQSDRRLDLVRGSQRCSKPSQLKTGHQAQVHSDQMVLVMARREAGPLHRRPKMLKRELENNSRSQGTQSENWQSDSKTTHNAGSRDSRAICSFRNNDKAGRLHW